MKAYTLTISTIEGVATQTVKRGSTTLTNGATIYYRDVLTITATADEKYGLPTVTSPITVTGNVDTANYITAGEYKKYTVTIVSSNTTYGTVDTTSIIVGHGTILRSNDTSGSGSEIQVVGLTSIWIPPAGANPGYWTVVPDLSIVATATPVESAAIDGNFDGWLIDGSPDTNYPKFNFTVTDNVTITAKFSGVAQTYTVTVVPNNSNYGSVSPTSVTNVPYGTALSLSGSYAYVGNTKLTATPKTDTAQYDYQHTGWTGASGTVTGNTTITANFRAVTRSYTVSYPAKPTGVSSFKIYKAGTAVVTDPTAAGSFTATYGDYVYATATATTEYNSPTISGISTNSGSPTQVTGAITVALTAGSKKTYTISYPAKPTGVASFIIYKNGTAVKSNPTSLGTFTATHGDTVYATATATTGYNTPTIGGVGTSSSTATTITAAKTITLTAGSVKSYTLSMPSITGVIYSIRRTRSPLQGASTSGALSNGATIYHGDVLSISAFPAIGYSNPTVSSSSVTVEGNVNASNYITAGTKATSLSAPVLGTITVDGDEEGSYLYSSITNNNNARVTAYVIWKDNLGNVESESTYDLEGGTSRGLYTDY